jgi:hypothetical protein
MSSSPTQTFRPSCRLSRRDGRGLPFRVVLGCRQRVVHISIHRYTNGQKPQNPLSAAPADRPAVEAASSALLMVFVRQGHRALIQSDPSWVGVRPFSNARRSDYCFTATSSSAMNISGSVWGGRGSSTGRGPWRRRGSIRRKSAGSRVDVDCSGVQKSTGILAERGVCTIEVGLSKEPVHDLIRSGSYDTELCGGWMHARTSLPDNRRAPWLREMDAGHLGMRESPRHWSCNPRGPISASQASTIACQQHAR